MKRKRHFSVEFQREPKANKYVCRVRITLNDELIFHWFARFDWGQQLEIEKEFAAFVENPDMPVTCYDVARFGLKMQRELRPAWMTDRCALLKRKGFDPC